MRPQTSTSIATGPKALAPSPKIVIPVVVGCLLAAGLWIEKAELFASARQAMRGDSVPSKALETGPLAKVLRTNGMFRAAVDEGGSFVYRLHGASLPLADSTEAALPALHKSWALISVTVHKEDLFDPEFGIFANYEQRWEVPAQASYFEGTELLAQVDCGLRLHGNSTRRPEVREKYGASARLYTRQTYGGGSLPLDLIFDGDFSPDARLIVRGESALSSALSFDIVRRIGANAPNMRPALYVLNGELQGMFSLSEHLTKDMWRERLGHGDFTFYRYRGSSTQHDADNYADLHAWVEGLQPGDVTMARIAENVDIESYIQHMFPFLWCGTDDWAQGAAYLDRGQRLQLWRWVNWDMDRSFRYSFEHDLENTEIWKKMCFDLVLADLSQDPKTPDEIKEANRVQREDVRSLIFTGLLRDDPKFQRTFAERAVGFMNHELNKAFLGERYQWYRKFRGEPGISPQALDNTGRFLRERSSFFRQDMARVFGLDPSFPVEVTGPPQQTGLALVIDGRLESLPYTGNYFAGQTITLDVPKSTETPESTAIQAWRVGDTPMKGSSLALDLEGPLEIQIL